METEANSSLSHDERRQIKANEAIKKSKHLLKKLLEKLANGQQPKQYPTFLQWTGKHLKILDHLFSQAIVRSVDHKEDEKTKQSNKEEEDKIDKLLEKIENEIDEETVTFAATLRTTDDSAKKLRNKLQEAESTVLQCMKHNHQLEAEIRALRDNTLKMHREYNDNHIKTKNYLVGQNRLKKFDRLANQKVSLLTQRINILERKLRNKNIQIHDFMNLKKILRKQKNLITHLSQEKETLFDRLLDVQGKGGNFGSAITAMRDEAAGAIHERRYSGTDLLKEIDQSDKKKMFH